MLVYQRGARLFSSFGNDVTIALERVFIMSRKVLMNMDQGDCRPRQPFVLQTLFVLVAENGTKRSLCIQ